MSNTQITTGKVRLSYVNLFNPRTNDDGTAGKYGCTIIIPKSDTKTLSKIKAAIAAAKERYTSLNPTKKAPANTTLHDGDGPTPNGDEYGPECKGAYVMSVSTKTRPVIVDRDKNPILDASEVYSGCYARVILNFYAYDTAGNRGISAGLNGVMKIADGEPLAGAVVTDADWDDDWDDLPEDDDLFS